MPIRVKLKVAAVCIACVSLPIALGAAASGLHPFAPLAVAAAGALGGLYALFVFLPRFDPTGSTLWRGPGSSRTVALTFDDGPGPDTARILDVLAEKGVKATFFFLGENARRHPGLVGRARAEGHAVGNHGMSHRKMHAISARGIEREIMNAEAAIGRIDGISGRKILRVPHGFKSFALLSAARRLGYVLVAWTAGVWDSDRPGPDVIARRAAAVLKPGCILLLHDGDGIRPDADRSRTAGALPAIIDHCLSAGYKFDTIPRLFDGDKAA
jgi:peptidoglycan/xylan/chitin deacetylase (PgdA/CDA1 family)